MVSISDGWKWSSSQGQHGAVRLVCQWDLRPTTDAHLVGGGVEAPVVKMWNKKRTKGQSSTIQPNPAIRHPGVSLFTLPPRKIGPLNLPISSQYQMRDSGISKTPNAIANLNITFVSRPFGWPLRKAASNRASNTAGKRRESLIGGYR
jgi:hypothetical protein